MGPREGARGAAAAAAAHCVCMVSGTVLGVGCSVVARVLYAPCRGLNCGHRGEALLQRRRLRRSMWGGGGVTRRYGIGWGHVCNGGRRSHSNSDSGLAATAAVQLVMGGGWWVMAAVVPFYHLSFLRRRVRCRLAAPRLCHLKLRRHGWLLVAVVAVAAVPREKRGGMLRRRWRWRWRWRHGMLRCGVAWYPPPTVTTRVPTTPIISGGVWMRGGVR